MDSNKPRRDWRDLLGGACEVNLIGGFYCCLTLTERNEWARHVNVRSELVTYHVAHARFGNDPSEQNGEAMIAATMVLHDIGEAWFEVLEKYRKDVAKMDREVAEAEAAAGGAS